MLQSKPYFLNLKKNEDRENGEEHRHCCCSHHKPDHHNESVEAPKKSDESETKE